MKRAVLAAMLLCCLAAPALADALIRNVNMSGGEENVLLNADVELDLPPRLEEIVSGGVPLYFVAEFELTRPRWYWFDETVSRRAITWRLSYHALTRQYRLASGALHQNFPDLEQAVLTMTRIRSWAVAGRGEVDNGTRYQAGMRFRLDLTLLPKPFQVTAIGNRDWNIGTDWLNWTFVPGQAVSITPEYAAQ